MGGGRRRRTSTSSSSISSSAVIREKASRQHQQQQNPSKHMKCRTRTHKNKQTAFGRFAPQRPNSHNSTSKEQAKVQIKDSQTTTLKAVKRSLHLCTSAQTPHGLPCGSPDCILSAGDNLGPGHAYCLCLYMHIYIYIYLFYLFIYMYICIFVYLCICVDIDKEDNDKDIDTDTYIYIYRCVCMYKCVYEKTYLFICTNL